MKHKEVPEPILEAINNNDFSQFETSNMCKTAIESLECWESLPKAIQLKILEELVPDDGIYSIK
jgi:hypothetical protein